MGDKTPVFAVFQATQSSVRETVFSSPTRGQGASLLAGCGAAPHEEKKLSHKQATPATHAPPNKQEAQGRRGRSEQIAILADGFCDAVE